MAYLKPQSPIKNGENYIYPLTMHDQIIMSDGSRFNVIDNLLSTSTTSSLSANQGKILKELVDEHVHTSSEITDLKSFTVKDDGDGNVVIEGALVMSDKEKITVLETELSMLQEELESLKSIINNNEFLITNNISG